MKIAVDTNILVRSVVRDDVQQAEAADKTLREASLVAVAVPCLCELVWVLRRVYAFSAAEIAGAIQALMDARNVVLNRPAVEMGLAILQAGGDFADGVIAYEGRWLGGETFLSFDTKAVKRMVAHGYEARRPT